MRIAKHTGIITAAALGLTLLATSSSHAQKGGDGNPQDPKDTGGGKGGGGGGKGGGGTSGGFEGQIVVPAPFARGTALLLMGDDDCRITSPAQWVGMGRREEAPKNGSGSPDTPGFPIACARTGQNLTCKVFKHGMTFAFDTTVKAETPAQLKFGTTSGYLEMVVDLQKRTGTFTQTSPNGKSVAVCQVKYKSKEDAADDVAKFDPQPTSLPAKDRPNGMSSGGDRHTCKSNFENLGAKDPLTGRAPFTCGACTPSDRLGGGCGFVGEECKAGICAYTGKDADLLNAGSEPSGGSSGGGSKTAAKKGTERGRMCGKGSDCQSGSCKMENRTRGRCQ